MLLASHIAVIGAGAAGLITAKTLVDDGLENVVVITRDETVGGVWARSRAYPELSLNNVHGEFNFSSLPMPPPEHTLETGGRLTGETMSKYFESFAEKFLRGRILFKTEVLAIVRSGDTGWEIKIRDLARDEEKIVRFDKIVLCTGGCSQPRIPPTLDATRHKFTGIVIHSSQWKENMERITSHLDSSRTEGRAIAIVGGGKSAHDIAAYLANRGHDVSIVFDKADSFIASPIPLPAFIRKSRLLSVLSPNIDLDSRLERFLHQTTLGSWLVRSFWSFLSWSSLKSLSVPANSPLANCYPMFWTLRLNDEGVGSPAGFYALARQGKIKLIAPTRAVAFDSDGHSVLLADGGKVNASAVVLATGYGSSWKPIFGESIMEEIGLARHPPSPVQINQNYWDYLTLRNAPAPRGDQLSWLASIYRGLVPVKRLHKRDIAVNGAIFTTNNGQVQEASAHWISSYFLEDPFLKIPSAEEALADTQRRASWLARRHPESLPWTNESYSSDISFLSWPQSVDSLLADMGLKTYRSRGNWLTWAFRPCSVTELAGLGSERRSMRKRIT